MRDDGLGDGVGAVLLDGCDNGNLFGREALHLAHAELSRCQGACFVKCHRVNPGDGVKIVPALEEDALP